MTSPHHSGRPRLVPAASPRAFAAQSGVSKEKNRVFVAMPYTASHADTLWNIIKKACKKHGFAAVRADKVPSIATVMADIWAEIEKAEIVIADLKDLNPNVLYEVGLAHAQCDSVILLCQEGQQLPINLLANRCIFYNLSNKIGKVSLSKQLGHLLDAIGESQTPTVIESPLERTRQIVNDLKILAGYPEQELRKQVVWFSGGLSAFAISDKEPFIQLEKDYREALLEERDYLLSLARKGCLVKGVITPPSRDFLDIGREDIMRGRIVYLLRFLKGPDVALKNIEWAVSPFRQKSLYIIGRISILEGYKKDIQRGFSLTLRQTGEDAINANLSLYEALFEHLSAYTLREHNGRGRNMREALRRATVNALSKSLGFLDDSMQKAAGQKVSAPGGLKSARRPVSKPAKSYISIKRK
jgi:hypothetical protein